jgi:hypothetical protein
MRQSAYAIGRPVLLFAVIIACCCLSGCGILQGMLGDLDTVEDSPPDWQQQDEEMQTLDASKDVSFSGGLSTPAFVYSVVAVRPAG